MGLWVCRSVGLLYDGPEAVAMTNENSRRPRRAIVPS
jgi:hypothetical protein